MSTHSGFRNQGGWANQEVLINVSYQNLVTHLQSLHSSWSGKSLPGKSTRSVDLSAPATAYLWDMSRIYPCEFKTQFPIIQVGNFHRHTACAIYWFYCISHLLQGKSAKPSSWLMEVGFPFISRGQMDICYLLQGIEGYQHP